ncbi:unnamed protein product [Bursaphelenchus okinawaensis]|uniref:Uncharacterized protein n=1 Tax=Bursaphelenchus okinawaensis TaxID=465554 RepID=A0A811LDR0_9BILA|nr:unnamed protein product [Bursaphelenchus okinawaensis]CAG9122008.1 unnamed protein product [Bursaphelenchus okinawaensis]
MSLSNTDFDSFLATMMVNLSLERVSEDPVKILRVAVQKRQKLYENAKKEVCLRRELHHDSMVQKLLKDLRRHMSDDEIVASLELLEQSGKDSMSTHNFGNSGGCSDKMDIGPSYDSDDVSPSCSMDDWEALGIRQDDECVQNEYSYHSAFSGPLPAPSSEAVPTESSDTSHCPTDVFLPKPVGNDGRQRSNKRSPSKSRKRSARWDSECATGSKQTKFN